jgi:uncharacterized Zn finger protein (UPF0148 family)
MSRTDSISAKLGEKMLSGWTLLNESCWNEECACPLVRSKQGVLMCVSCGYTENADGSVVNEGTVNIKAPQQAAAKNPPVEATKSTISSQSPLGYSTNTDESRTISRDPVASTPSTKVAGAYPNKSILNKPAQSTSSTCKQKLTSTNINTISIPECYGTSQETGARIDLDATRNVLAQTSATILNRLHVCQNELASMDNPVAVRDMAETIQVLVTTLKSVQGAFDDSYSR